MKRYLLVLIVVACIVGLAIGLASNTSLDNVTDNTALETVSQLILGFGLYYAVLGINLQSLQKVSSEVTLSVTFGVCFKAVLIGALVYPFVDSLLVASITGLIFAQIDPLGSAVLKIDYRSPDVMTWVQSWASFDDPLTTLLALLIVGLWASDGSGLGPAGQYLALLLVSFVLVVVVSRFAKRLDDLSLAVLTFMILLAAVFSGAVAVCAVCGLLFRPKSMVNISEDATIFLYLISAGLACWLLAITGVNLGLVLLVAVLAHVTHVVTVAVVARKIDKSDRALVMTAHRSGITAISLTLYAQSQGIDVAEYASLAVPLTVLIGLSASYLTQRRINAVEITKTSVLS